MSSTSAATVYVGTFVHCETLTKLSTFHGWIMVDRNGTIVRVVDDPDAKLNQVHENILDLGWKVEDTSIFHAEPNQFFFPGFIDTHIHAPQYPNAGIFGKTTLLDWLKTYTYPMEASLSDVVKARKVYETCVSNTLAHGTTTASYYATIHVESTQALASICKDKGQRALIGRVCMNHPNTLVDYYRDKDAEASHQANLAVIEYIKTLDPSGSLVVPILTPRSCISCTSEHLYKLRDMVNDPTYPLHVQTHLSENFAEMEQVKKTWPDYPNYTAVYDAHGLLTPRMILAHAIHLDQSERQCIADRGAKISHCPVSNSALGSGMCKVRQLMDNGIVVGLGTDISGGYSPSILEAARHACLVSRLVAADVEWEQKSDSSKATRTVQNSGDAVPEWDRVKLSVEEALWMATRGGAEVVCWQEKLGAFKPGFQFDAQLVMFDLLDAEKRSDRDLGNLKVFGWESWDDRIAKWVYLGDDRNTQKVWVNGKLVHAR